VQYAVTKAGPDVLEHDLAHLLLLLFNRGGRVDDVKTSLGDHRLVLIENPALKDPKTFLDIAA
jgi:hypothetical protein